MSYNTNKYIKEDSSMIGDPKVGCVEGALGKDGKGYKREKMGRKKQENESSN